MFIFPTGPQYYRMLAIDNGSGTMGLSVLDLDVMTGQVYVEYSETCDAGRTRAYQWMSDAHGDRFARYAVLRDNLSALLHDYDPEIVAIESPFSRKRFPEAFAVLREALLVVRQTVMEYAPLMPVELISPTEAKSAVGCVYRKGDDPKAAVRAAVLARDDIQYRTTIDPHQLDEHCIDSIAVGYCHAKRVMNDVWRDTGHAS